MWVAVALASLALVAAGAWWLSRERIGAARVVTVVVEQRSGQTAGTVLNASGYVTARRRATLSAKITGKVVEVLIEEGTTVRKGDVVARLDDAEAAAALALSESRLAVSRRAVEETHARLAQAELDRDRARRLVAADVAQQADLDRAETDVDALEARLALQREEIAVADREVALRKVDLENTVVRAPFDGVVVSKDAQPGEMVSPISAGGGFTRTGLCTVVDMDSLEIEVDVNESYISRVRAGQQVEAVLDAYPDWRIPAHVITVIPTADRQKATVLVRIGFEQLDDRILPDMGVKVSFLELAGDQAEASRPRVFAPRSALRTDGDRDVMFVVLDGRVERRAVTVGGGSGDSVEVVAGVRPGEHVVVEGPADLSDGQRVVAQ